MYQIIKGGCNSKHPKGFIMRQPAGIPSYIILIVKTPARFQIGAQSFVLHQPAAVLIPPNTPYSYFDLAEGYKNDFLRFFCSDPDFSAKYEHLMDAPVLIGNTLHYTQYIQHILWEYHYADESYKNDNISMLFRILLNKLCQEKAHAQRTKIPTPYTSRLQDLRLAMISEPNKNFSAEELADSLHLSPSYFQHLYKELFDIPFKKDLINMRIDYAQSLITGTNLTLEQIAQASGYSNEIHFYRQFKAKTGMTPREYATAMQRLSLIKD